MVYAMGWPDGEMTMLGESLFCPFCFFVFVSEKAAEWREKSCSARGQFADWRGKKKKRNIMEKSKYWQVQKEAKSLCYARRGDAIMDQSLEILIEPPPVGLDLVERAGSEEGRLG